MKYLTIILLLISFNLSGQYNNDRYKVIGMSCLQTVSDAIGDGLMDSGHKEAGHLVNAATVGLYVIEPAFITYDSWNVTLKAISLVGARLLLFNVTYNLTRG